MDTKIKVKDIMTAPAITVTKDTTIVKTAELMNKFRIGGLPVVDNDGNFSGMVTERDIMKRVIAADKQPSSLRVKDVMSSPVKVTAHSEENMQDIANKMMDYDVTRIPILQDKKVLGIVTNRDIVKYGPQLIDVLVEQARIKGNKEPHESVPTSFGLCELCGISGERSLKNDKFVCNDCLNN